MGDGTATDDQISQYRERFRTGPVGIWTTWLGNGWDAEYGCQFEFRPDFTGHGVVWDSNDGEQDTDAEFVWSVVSDFTINIQPVGELKCKEDWGVFRYDFRWGLSKYSGHRKLFLYEVGHHCTEKPGFWWSPNPVVLADENPRMIFTVRNLKQGDGLSP